MKIYEKCDLVNLILKRLLKACFKYVLIIKVLYFAYGKCFIHLPSLTKVFVVRVKVFGLE
jgi:hypothetical protein